MQSDLFGRRGTHFVLWAPGQAGLAPAPALVIGTLQPGTPPVHAGRRRLMMPPVAGISDLWAIAAADCGLTENAVYHYWFEVTDTRPGSDGTTRVLVTDPLTTTPDWRLTEADGEQPAAVIRFAGGALTPCDQSGIAVGDVAEDNPGQLTPNNFTVIYELPTAWMRRPRGAAERGVGTFRDIAALLDKTQTAPNFDGLDSGHLAELGVNAMELLPPADSFYERQWGYGTSHLFAPDSQLGQPDYYSWSTANADLQALTALCHRLRIRVIADVVMAFARSGAYERASFDAFHIDVKRAGDDDPDKWNSRQGSERGWRMNYDAALWRYVRESTTYDPVSGGEAKFVPARSLQLLAQQRWTEDFHIDGFRIDSVENVANWDFLQSFTEAARSQFRERCAAHGVSATEADARFLVVGEELSLPLDILWQGRLTALWNDRFRVLVRSAVAGLAAQGESFASTVTKMVDCRQLGFTDMAQAVIYIGSHDVEGQDRERLATSYRRQFPDVNSASDNAEIARRVKLAFACLLTAVGIPMILAGDEFADENDLFNLYGAVTNDSGKQMDPVSFSRLADGWRQDVLQCVKNLIALRTSHPALGVNDTKWLHQDSTPGREIWVWQRGGDDNPVIVVANFSAFATANPFNPASEYVVPNWPGRDQFAWKEVCLNRAVGAGWAGREPVFPWEAKVYVHG